MEKKHEEFSICWTHPKVMESCPVLMQIARFRIENEHFRIAVGLWALAGQ
jgi:hypothetical protein